MQLDWFNLTHPILNMVSFRPELSPRSLLLAEVHNHPRRRHLYPPS